MRYSFFERLVLAVGGAAIIGSLLLSYRASLVAEEVIAQVLLLGVLIGAVHWGRRGGFISAVAASLVYAVLRIPLAIQEGGLTADVATLLLIRLLSYGLVGIVGGELCGRIRYILARLEDSSSVDEWSQLYNQRFICRALESALGQYGRYQTPFSTVRITVNERVYAELRDTRQRTLIRGVADHIRNDIRLVDEVGRLDDSSFLVVLPHTPLEGGTVVSERLREGVCRVLGAREESVTSEVLGAPEDAEALVELHRALASAPNGCAPQD